MQTTYEGKTTYVDHSCGHDIHMAAWVGTAKALVELKGRWHGTLMFIAQPAEEVTDAASGHDPRTACSGKSSRNLDYALRPARRFVRMRLKANYKAGRVQLELR